MLPLQKFRFNNFGGVPWDEGQMPRKVCDDRGCIGQNVLD